MNMRLIAVGLVSLLGVFGAGCGNVCDDATDLCLEAEGIDEPTGDAVEQDCSGGYQCESQCKVDLDSCDFTTQELNDCVEACAG